MRESERRRLKLKKLEELEKKNRKNHLPKSHFFISRNKAIFAKQKQMLTPDLGN
jgi:hypothetical protein